jgi:hypothetical protein
MRLALGLMLLALLAGGVQAQEEESFPIEPGKINANDTGTLEPGQIEIQPGWAGFFSTRAYDELGASLPDSDVRQDQYFTQLTFGVVENFDVNMTVGLSAGRDSAGGTDPVTGDDFFLNGHSLSDLTFGTRWRFFHDEESGLALAYLTYTTFPTAQHGSEQSLALSQEVATLQHRLAVQKDVGHWSLLADLGCLHPLASNGPGFEAGLSMNLAAGYQLTEEFQPLVEVAYNSAYYTNDPYSGSWTVTGGGTYYVTPDVRLNLGVTQTIAGHSSRDGLTATFFVTILR